MCFASAFTISFLTYIIGDLDDPIHGSFTLSFVVPQCEDLVHSASALITIVNARTRTSSSNKSSSSSTRGDGANGKTGKTGGGTGGESDGPRMYHSAAGGINDVSSFYQHRQQSHKLSRMQSTKGRAEVKKLMHTVAIRGESTHQELQKPAKHLSHSRSFSSSLYEEGEQGEQGEEGEEGEEGKVKKDEEEEEEERRVGPTTASGAGEEAKSSAVQVDTAARGAKGNVEGRKGRGKGRGEGKTADEGEEAEEKERGSGDVAMGRPSLEVHV